MSKILGIKGSNYRGSEVIEILEMLGGKTSGGITGRMEGYFYFIDEEGEVNVSQTDYDYVYDKYEIMFIEEFKKKYPFKVGDTAMYYSTKVVISSMKWNGNKILYGFQITDNKGNRQLYEVSYDLLKPCENKIYKKIVLDFETYGHGMTELVIDENFMIQYDDDRYYIVRKYPKDFIDCCDILNIGYEDFVVECGYKQELTENMRRLWICLDAFDKLFEREIKQYGKKYALMYVNGELYEVDDKDNAPISFCTKEARDYFLKYFKPFLEKCKEKL